jgi:hypothetical protein
LLVHTEHYTTPYAYAAWKTVPEPSDRMRTASYIASVERKRLVAKVVNTQTTLVPLNLLA